MKKELIYLSLPDYFNKNLLINFNQRPSYNNSLNLQFKLSSSSHLGSAIKAILILEFIFPRKVKTIRLKIKVKKISYSLSTKKPKIVFNFNMNISGFDFISFYRFFAEKPLDLNNLNEKTLDILPLVNRRLKNFDYFKNLKIIPNGLNNSFLDLKMLHLN